MVGLQFLEDKISLLHRLFLGERLREEVHAHVNPGCLGALDVSHKEFIQRQLPGDIAAIAQADDGKLNACFLHLLPVDFTLVGRDVDAGNAFAGVALIIADAVLFEKLPRLIAVAGQTFQGVWNEAVLFLLLYGRIVL